MIALLYHVANFQKWHHGDHCIQPSIIRYQICNYKVTSSGFHIKNHSCWLNSLIKVNDEFILVSSSTRSMPATLVTSTSVNPSVSYVTSHSDTSNFFTTPSYNTRPTDSNCPSFCAREFQVNDRGKLFYVIVLPLTTLIIMSMLMILSVNSRHSGIFPLILLTTFYTT